MEKKARILVVEDDTAILDGLSDVLVFNGYEVEGREDGGLGLKEALDGTYDLVLLDVMLPTLDGFSICTALRREKPALPVIMLTAKGSEEDIVAGFKAGADDYVCKPFSLRELMVRVEAVLRRSGKGPVDERLEICGISFDGGSLFATLGEEKVELTRREMEIISYLHRNKDRITGRKDLLRDVWRYGDADVETRTVDIHMLKLRKKIAQLTEDPVIMTVRGAGYRLRIEE